MSRLLPFVLIALVMVVYTVAVNAVWNRYIEPRVKARLERRARRCVTSDEDETFVREYVTRLWSEDWDCDEDSAYDRVWRCGVNAQWDELTHRLAVEYEQWQDRSKGVTDPALKTNYLGRAQGVKLALDIMWEYDHAEDGGS